jgi:hypothetical protein
VPNCGGQKPKKDKKYLSPNARKIKIHSKISIEQLGADITFQAKVCISVLIWQYAILRSFNYF